MGKASVHVQLGERWQRTKVRDGERYRLHHLLGYYQRRLPAIQHSRSPLNSGEDRHGG